MLLCNTCSKSDSQQEMIDLLAQAKKIGTNPENPFGSTAKLHYIDSVLESLNHNQTEVMYNE